MISSKPVINANSSTSLHGPPEVVKVIMVLYVGGTIGMMPNRKGGALRPVENVFVQKLAGNNQTHDQVYFQENDLPHDVLVLPLVDDEVRIIYRIVENEKLMDSCNMGAPDWESIASSIKKHYMSYDAFVIVQGTDTLSFTASALSFILKNLTKPVIVTGAQLPIFNVRSDAIKNLVHSLVIAGSYYIPEVLVFFGDNLMRANFPNYDPHPSRGELIIQTGLNQNVVIITLFPNIHERIVQCCLEEPTEGVVLQTYGSGNMASDRHDIITNIRKANDRGVIIINCTRCTKGGVKPVYETSQVLVDAGVLSAYDMTIEASFTKLQYVLSLKDLTLNEKKQMMQTNLKGEMMSPN